MRCRIAGRSDAGALRELGSIAGALRELGSIARTFDELLRNMLFSMNIQYTCTVFTSYTMHGTQKVCSNGEYYTLRLSLVYQ